MKRNTWIRDEMGYGDRIVITGVLATIVAVIAIIVAIAMVFEQRVTKIDCGKLAPVSGLHTKVVDYGFWDTGTCFVQIADGRWIPEDAWRAQVQG